MRRQLGSNRVNLTITNPAPAWRQQMYSNWNNNQAEKPPWQLGCFSLTILIVGGIWYWNHWTSEIDKKVRQDVERMQINAQKHMEHVSREQIQRDVSEWNKRNWEQMQPVIEAGRLWQQRQMERGK
jgi:hypothetical protein